MKTKLSLRLTCLCIFLINVFTQAQDISIYRLNSYGYGDGRLIRFVPLSDGLRMSENPDSALIAERYLGENPIVEDNFHVLDQKRRGITLNTLGLSEKDIVYIFDLSQDTVYKVPVSEADIVAFINPYGTNIPIPAYDYMIGIHVTEDLLPTEVVGKYISDPLVFVGPSNPFVPSRLERIVWTKMDSSECPNVEVESRWRDISTYYKGFECYTYKSSDYVYFLKDYGGARHLLVRNEKTQQIELNQFYWDSEGSYLKPLNGLHSDEEHGTYQYTGPIIRFKPRLVYGMIGFSFGCESIHFVSPTEKPIYIRCDNRH